MGLPTLSSEKSGVSVSPFTSRRSSSPAYLPIEERMPAMPGNGRRTGVVAVPGPEFAGGGDFSLGLGVGQRAFERERFKGANFMQSQIVNFPIERFHAGLLRKSEQFHVLNFDRAHHHLNAVQVFYFAWRRRFP